MDKNFEEKFKELRKGYINKLKSSFIEFKALLYENPININEIYSRVHTISGTSGMYGINDVSKLSTEFEIHLKPFKDNLVPINIEELKTNFLNYLESMETALSIGE